MNRVIIRRIEIYQRHLYGHIYMRFQNPVTRDEISRCLNMPRCKLKGVDSVPPLLHRLIEFDHDYKT